MSPQDVLTVGQQALWIAGLVAAPMLLAALVVGLVISILQAATSVNEMTLSFIPKLIFVFLALVAAGPWMLETMVDFLQRTLSSIAFVGG